MVMYLSDEIRSGQCFDFSRYGESLDPKKKNKHVNVSHFLSGTIGQVPLIEQRRLDLGLDVVVASAWP